MSSVAMSGSPSVLSIDDLSESENGSASSVPIDAEHPSHTPTPGGVEVTLKHPRFYYEDGSLTLMIGGTLFRVHGSIFVSLSPFWAEKLKSAASGLVHRIEDASSEEMVSFLSILYPRTFDAPEVETVAEWTAVLRLATMWDFEAVRRLALKQLDAGVLPLERLVLGRAHDLPGWLGQAFVDCVLREDLPTSEEMQGLALTLNDFACIAWARDAIAKGRLSADAHSVLLHVRENVLTVAPVPSTGSSLTKTSTPVTHVRHQKATSSQPTILPHKSRSLAIERAASSSSSFQSESQTAVTNPSTALLTPAPLASTFTYVPYPPEERATLSTSLVNTGSFASALESIALASVPAFCEALCEYTFTYYGNEFIQSVTSRVARDLNFHHAGLHIVGYTIKTFKSQYDSDPYWKALLTIYKNIGDAQLNEDNVRFTLEYLTSASVDSTSCYVTGCLGQKGFLAYHPAIFRQRVQRLVAFLAALVKAGLIHPDVAA